MNFLRMVLGFKKGVDLIMALDSALHVIADAITRAKNEVHEEVKTNDELIKSIRAENLEKQRHIDSANSLLNRLAPSQTQAVGTPVAVVEDTTVGTEPIVEEN